MQRPKIKVVVEEEEEEEDCYQRRREEMRGSHFFKIIQYSCMQDRRLVIPKKFIRRFGKELSNIVVLKVPSSKEWNVELKEDEGQVWFQTGWYEFAEYHSIYIGHFLVFRYEGNSRFSVVLCDVSTSEIEYPCDTEDLEEPRNGIGSPASPEQENEEKITEVCPPKHVMDESNGRKTRKSCNTALAQPRFSLGSVALKKDEPMRGLGFLKKRKLLSAQSKRPGCSPSLAATQEDTSRKKRASTIVIEKKRVEQEGSEDSHFMFGVNAANDISNSGCRRNNEPTSFTLPKETSNHLCDENIHVTKNMDSKQISDSCVQATENPRESFHNRKIDKIRLEECEVFGSIFNIESTGTAHDFDCQNKYSQTRSSLPSSQFIRSCSDDLHQVNNVGGSSKPYSSPLYTGIQSNMQSNTTMSKRAELDSYHTKQKTRTTVLSIPREKGLLSEHRRPQEREHTTLAAKSFTSENPYCNVTIRPTHVNHSMVNLPIVFANAYLKEKIQPVTLQVSDGRAWQVNCSSRENNFRLLKGWKEFVLDNHLVVDDICIFELVDKKHRKLKVSIFRVIKNPKLQKKNSTKCKRPSGTANCLVRRKGKLTEDNTKKRKFSDSKEKNRVESRGITEHGSPVPIQVQAHPISGANAFSSESPCCTVTMRSSYVSQYYKLCLPVAFANTYLKDNVQPVLLQVPDGRTWQVNCASSKYYFRLVKGWRKFVLDNHLEEDDICIFKLVDKRHCKLTVDIFRALNDPKQKKGLSQSKSPSANPFCLVRNKGKQDEDHGSKRKLFDLKENKRLEQMGNEEHHFIIDKNVALDLANSYFQSTGAPITSNPQRFTSSWVEEKKRKFLPRMDSEYIFHPCVNGAREGGSFYCPNTHALNLSSPSSFTPNRAISDNPTGMKEIDDPLEISSSNFYMNIQSSERNTRVSETTADDSHHTMQGRHRKTSTVVKGPTSIVSLVQLPLANQVKERSITAARAFTSENPFCTITMRRTYVHEKFNLNIPKDFAYKYMKDASQGLTLRLSDRGTWRVPYNRDSHKIIKGWKAFVLDNHLREDDVCILELVDKKHMELEVHIFRVCPAQLCA